ncbi:BCCT family transporter [Yaniella halotolerans]|uniref:BCCT family transporter n=1 Tax=Yaniella halotolerans TaxID=225453 RepID=UPI0003B3DB02|nr:BCCT family transporter [Yaniella halotolerans]
MAKTEKASTEPKTQYAGQQPADGEQKAPVEVPRFMGRQIPPLDRLLITIIPPVLIVVAVIWVIADSQGAADAIGALRTFVTGEFTWLFVLYSLIALAVCIWAAFSKFGKVRLGGPKAKPLHGRFAWYSMLFACGQGIGLIFWSVAEPIMLREENPVIPAMPAGGGEEGAIVWTYFHWGLTAWAMYCVVALCLAYSHHNLGKTLTFREATVDILPKKAQRPAGVVVELLAIMATVLGLATSFGFAAMQFGSGVTSFTGIESGPAMWMIVIGAFAAVTGISAFIGINKGMARLSGLNSILSIVLVVAVFVFGPTIYMISTLTQTFGSFGQNFISMSFFTDFPLAASSLETWQDSWNGWWTVFIWCWVIAFSPFVAGFVARISRGRTIRDFVIGVTVVPSLIVMVWVGILGAAAVYYDDQTDRSISEQVAADTSSGLFAMLEQVPFVGTVLLIVATILVATYYITSLDSGTYALGEFVTAPRKSSPFFRVVLVLSIGTVATVLLAIGGEAVVDTVQTGTIIGAFPFSFVILLMIANFVRRLKKRNKEIRRMERAVNDPDPERVLVPNPDGEGFTEPSPEATTVASRPPGTDDAQ